MKARIATVLSLTGVLVAGSAAALVNNEVLRPPSASDRSRSTADSIVQLQFAEPPAGVMTPEQTPPAATQATYVVPGAAAITLDVAGDALTLISVAPVAGWSVVSSLHHDPTTMEVVLQAGTTRVEFHASLLYGIVNTAVETTDVAGPSPTTGGTTARPRPTSPTTPSTSDDADDDGGSDDQDDDADDEDEAEEDD